MVIDKWTRISSNNNNSLITPLLGHKSKETFAELKQSYERLKFLNHNIKKWRHPPIRNGQLLSKGNENPDIKEYIEQVNLTLISINELLDENYNFDQGVKTEFNANEKNNIFNRIKSQCDIFSWIIKNLNVDKSNKDDGEIKLDLAKSQTLINNIYDKFKKYKFIGNITIEQEQHYQNILNINPNIDRGHINIFTGKKEFNNSITIEKNNIRYSVEEEPLVNTIRLLIFLFMFCFLSFVFYICIL